MARQNSQLKALCAVLRHTEEYINHDCLGELRRMAEIRDGWRRLCGNLGNALEHLENKERTMDKQCIKALNKAFAQPTLAKFDTALSAAEIYPQITIKRDPVSLLLWRHSIVEVTFRDQKLEVSFGRRGKVVRFEKIANSVHDNIKKWSQNIRSARPKNGKHMPQALQKKRNHARMLFTL